MKTMRIKSVINRSKSNLIFTPVRSKATFSESRVLKGDKIVSTKKTKSWVVINLIMPKAPPKTHPRNVPKSGMFSKKETDVSTVPKNMKTCQNRTATTIPGIK